ncbi:TM2 domain-containing protein [uncultured Clostridium sp.]|uniref:TM2 domain-containing protein n=1 Tax=uncultured Clostridium sp. TaxID=59620 RepID=UPI00345C4836
MENQLLNNGINPSWPVKNKIVAALLAIFVGGLGIHKFYLGKIGLGIVYLVLCWTCIPSFIAFIEGIIYLCSDDYKFQIKNQVRLG